MTNANPQATAQRRRICLKTYGCAHNVADSERMAGLLTAAGYVLVDDESAAELLIVNSCTVKGPSEERFRLDLRRASLRGQPVVAAGCVPGSHQPDPSLQLISTIGTRDIARVVEVVERTLAGEKVNGEEVRCSSRRAAPMLQEPVRRRNRLIAIIPVGDGCLGNCSYCATVLARGRLESRRKEDILRAITCAVREGAKEVWLCGEDVGAYGKDRAETLPMLLSEIAQLPGDFMVRIGMMNPQYVREYLRELVEILRSHPLRFFRFLHLPVQSGSDLVLRSMRRGYRLADFEDAVRSLLQQLPDLTLATDIIVGFPTESEAEFQETLSLVSRERVPIMNISRFYSRPGTAAALLTQLPSEEVARRCKEAVTLYRSYDPNRHVLGSVQDALFTETGPHGSLVGHTRAYVQVIVRGLREDAREEALGAWRRVRIVGENKFRLVGELMESE
jgi:threonylcarbamoyladenosine tRNA methylthiotransferase CDKAL1